MEIINSDKTEEIRKQAEKMKKTNKPVIVLGRDIEFNRKILDMKKVYMLVLQHSQGRDKLKQRDSGLNEILCRIAQKNNITLALDFKEIKNSEEKERAKILGRIIQNIKLARKYKNKLILLNKSEDKTNIQALFQVLGADTKTASKIAG